MRTFVKFTGMTDPETVRRVPDGGAAGFVVDVPQAPGNLTLEAAASLVEVVPKEAEAWAVVVNPPAELIHRLFDEVGVDRIEVHGAVPEGLEFLEIHHLVPSLPIPLRGVEGPEPKVPPAEDYSRLHLDHADSLVGASAALVDWDMCSRLVEAQPGRKLVLAGGLTAENVGDALAAVRPWGLDVGAGVESAPGQKSLVKMEEFLAAVTRAEGPSG